MNAHKLVLVIYFLPTNTASGSNEIQVECNWNSTSPNSRDIRPANQNCACVHSWCLSCKSFQKLAVSLPLISHDWLIRTFLAQVNRMAMTMVKPKQHGQRYSGGCTDLTYPVLWVSSPETCFLHQPSIHMMTCWEGTQKNSTRKPLASYWEIPTVLLLCWTATERWDLSLSPLGLIKVHGWVAKNYTQTREF